MAAVKWCSLLITSPWITAISVGKKVDVALHKFGFWILNVYMIDFLIILFLPQNSFSKLEVVRQVHEISSKLHRSSSKDWGLCLRVCWLWCPSIGPWNTSWETRCIKTCWHKSYCSFFIRQRQTHRGRSPHGLPFWWVLNQSLITCKKRKACFFSRSMCFFAGFSSLNFAGFRWTAFSKSSKHVFF